MRRRAIRTLPDCILGLLALSLCAAYVQAAAPTINSVVPNNGPTTGGTPVTITGTNFAAGATVTFDGTPGTGVTVSSSTSILVGATPAHTAGAVDVVVAVAGLSGTLKNGFVYGGTTPEFALPGGSPLTYTVTLGDDVNLQVTAIGAPAPTIAFPAGTDGAPKWLLVTSTGLLSGQALTLGTFLVQLAATNAVGSVTTILTLTVTLPSSTLSGQVTFTDSYALKNVTTRSGGGKAVQSVGYSSFTLAATIPNLPNGTPFTSDTEFADTLGNTANGVVFKSGKSAAWTFLAQAANGKDVTIGTITVSLSKAKLSVKITGKDNDNLATTQNLVLAESLGTNGPISGTATVVILLGAQIAVIHVPFTGKDTVNSSKGTESASVKGK